MAETCRDFLCCFRSSSRLAVGCVFALVFLCRLRNKNAVLLMHGRCGSLIGSRAQGAQRAEAIKALGAQRQRAEAYAAAAAAARTAPRGGGRTAPVALRKEVATWNRC